MNNPSVERRQSRGNDRRKNPRSGRRATDPRAAQRWRRAAWLFAAYAAFLSVRSLPASVRRFLDRRRTAA